MDGQNFDPSFGKAEQGPITVKAPEIKVAQPTFNVQDFEDEEVNRAKEEGSVQFASGVVRVSDAPTYNLPEVNKSLYGEKLGITRASELRAAVGLKDNESFTEYYKTNKFVPTGFDIDAKILLREEKIKGLEQQVAQGKMGYQTFLYKAYGEDLLKADGHDLKSSLYWYNRRKQGMFDSPIDNVTYLTSLLQQAETLYQKELWHSESNTRTIQNSFLGQMGDKNTLPTDKIRDLFEEQFKQLDAMVESDEEKIRLYKAGLLRGFTPTIDEDGDGKVDWYLHRDGNLYRVREAGSDAADTKAVSYYNEDGSLDRIEIDGMFGVYGDQFVQGFGGAIAGVADLFIYGAVGIADTLENLFTGNWEYDKLADVYKEVEGFKASTYLLGNNVYTTSNGWRNADGTIDGDGIARGVARGVGTLAGMIALSGIGTSLSNFGVGKAKIIDQVGKQAVSKAIIKDGFFSSGIRSIGNAINGVVGLSQGVYRAGSSSAVLTATQATVRGLGFLAVKDFSTTVASLTASKDLIGISDEEIIGKSLTMTGLNFGLSFLLRSVGNTPATTRLASWWKAKFQKTAEIKAAGALDDTFADKLLRWAANENQRKSFIFANSAMDLAENMLTMGTQTSLASTGKLFDKEAWKGLLDPQNLALQGLLFRNNVSGGLRGDDMQMGAEGVAAQLDNLNKVYNGDIINRMLSIASDKLASGKDTDIKAAETINLAVKEANVRKDKEKNPAIGIQKAIVYLHETFKDDGDMSFVRDAIMKTYNKARTDEIVLGTKAAIETYTSVVAAKLNMQKDALLKGNIFGPGTFVSSKLTDSKVAKIKGIAQQFEGALANLARYSLDNKVSSFDLLTQTTIKTLASNKADFERIATLSGVKLDNIGEVKFEPLEVKQPDGSTKTEFKIVTADGEIFIDENLKLIGDFIATVGKGDPNNLKNWTVITMPNAGDDTQSARTQTIDLFNTLADIAKTDESPDIISPIYRLANGTYIVPSFNDGVTIKTLSELHGALANLYGVKYNVKVEDKAVAFRNLFEAFTGKAYSKDQNVEAAQMLNKLIANGFITFDQAAGLLNSTMFSNIKTDASIDLKNLTMLNKALVFAKGVKLLEAYREANSKDPATRDDSVVEKIRREFMDYYTNELQSEPELQLLLSKRNGFSKQDLLNYVKENPLKDKDRLLSLYQTLSEGLGINEDSQVEDILRKDILNELTELTGIKDIVSQFIPDAVADGLRKISADGKTNLGKVIQKLLEAKSPQDLRSQILSLGEAKFSEAIDESVEKKLLVKPDGTAWTPEEAPQLKAELLDNLKKNFYNIKGNVIKDMLFNGQDELFYKDLISAYDDINKPVKKEPVVEKYFEEVVEEKEVQVGVRQVEETIVEDKKVFNETPTNEKTYLPYENDFKIVEINGKQFLQYGDRWLAVVEYKGVKIPFYFSSGENVKEGVTPNRWYATGGVSKEWINKPGSKAIRNFNYSPIVRAMSEFLSDKLNLPEKKEFGVYASNEEIAIYNEGLKPVLRNDSPNQFETFKIIKDRIDAIDPNASKTKIETKLIKEVPVFEKQTFTRQVEKTRTIQPVLEVKEEMSFKTTLDKIISNKDGDRDFVYERILSNPKYIDSVFARSPETKHLETALKLYEQTYIKDTISRRSSGKIVLNVNELLGNFQARFKEALNNPYKASNILSAASAEDKLRQVFGEKYVRLAKDNLSIEAFVAQNLYHMYKDRIIAGNIEFNFSIVNGKVMLSDEGDKAILDKTLNDLGYKFFDLQETLDNIPGIYFKFQNEDAAIDLEFDKAESGGLSAKALFLDGLRKKGTLSWDDVSKKAYIANVDFEELLINQTGNLNYIDDNTVITFKGKELPRYYGTLNFEISNRVQSILDASPNINIKQGRNGGALFKAYFLSRVLPGVLSDVDVALKRNVFVLDVIDTIDAYIEKIQEGVSEDKTFILSEMVLSKKQIEDFKTNGDLYDFDFVKTYEDKSGRDLGIYIVKPKLDFKTRALAYIETNRKINLNYLLPEEARGSRNALEQFGSENKVFGPGDNVALANNARLLKTSTTGYDLTRFVNDYIRQSYSENFITETYLVEVPFNKVGLNLENNIIDFLKGKTYKEILSLGNSIVPGTNLRLNETIYYEMLSRFLNGSKKLSDELLTRLGIDEENKDLNLILSDEEVRKLLGKELQVLLRQTVDTTTEDRSKDNPIKDKNDPRIEALKNKVNRLISTNKVSKFAEAATSYQLLMHGTEPNGKTSIDSYSVSKLGLENNIKTTVTNDDIFSIYQAATTDNEFQMLSSFSLEGRIDPVVSKIKAITSTSDSKDENRLSIFVDDLYRLSNEEFINIYQYLKDAGVKKSSLDLLQQKYNFINENSTFYNAAFKTNTDQDSYYIEERLVSVAGLPAAVRADTISISLKDGPYSKKNLERWIENAINKPFISSNLNSKAIKTSAVDIDTRNPFYNLMANLKNRIEKDAESPLTGSRLVQNLQHYEFLGKLIYNVISLSKNLETVFEKKNIKISREDAVKIALTMFNQTTGVTYDKFYADIFFYDTETKTIKAVTGSGNSDKALGYVASKYITDYADKKPGTIIAFQVDKDALLSSSVRAFGAVKYMVLDNQKTKTLNHLVNNFVFREYDKNPPKELESDPNTKDVFAHVLARYTNQSDRLDHITSTLVKLKIPQQYARSLAKTLFFNGQNVSVGSNKDSLAAAKAMNTLKLNDPNYRTSNVKENNVQKSLNDALYFINVNDLPSDYTRELRTMAGDYEVSLSKDNNYRQDVVETVRLILSNGVKNQDVLNKMEAFANKAGTLELKKQFLQDVTALYILKKNDGATHNFLLLDNNINQLMIKATSANKLDFVTQNGTKIEASRLLADNFFVGDIENAWYMDGKNEVPLVLELSLNQYKGIQNIEKFFNENEELQLVNKNTITVPAFYKGKVLTEDVLIKETGGSEVKLSREQRLEKLLPEYFNKFYKQFTQSGKFVWDNYFKNIEGVIKKYNVKNKEDAGRYLIQRANDFGYDGNKVLLSFNGKSHDFGTNDKDSILNKAGIINKDNTFFQNKHVDIFNDLYTSNRFEVDSYADQQGMALVDIASKLGIKYDNAHTSSSDVDATTQIAIKLLANISNSNRFTSNILNVFEDLRTNLGLSDTDINSKEQVNKVPQLNKSFLTKDTEEFIKNYKDAFDEKNIKDFNKAFETIVNSLKDYLDNIEKEVKRKQVRELIRDELGRKLEFYERVQKNSNEFASILEYLIFKQQRFNSDLKQKLDKNNLLSKKADETGVEFSNKSGFLKLYDLLKDVFGDEYEILNEKGNTKTFKSLSALGLEKIFSLDPREFFTAIESYFADNSIVNKTPGYQYPGFELSYNDYLSNKNLYTGKPLKDVVAELKSDGTLAAINESEESYRLSEKFFRNYDSIFGSIVEGFDKNIQDIIFNEAATPYLKNLALSEEQFKNRILNKGLKLNDSKFSAELKKLIENSSFGTTFHYNAFFEQANQADYLKKYEFENGLKGFIGPNEIGLTAKKYEELTGLSYSDAQSLFKTKDGGSIYLNVMRHPVDKIGSIASLKVRILADTPENNRLTVLVNTDMLYSILAGDVDGDYLTIITPTKGMVKFNQDLNRYIKKGNDLVGQAIQSLSNPKLVNDSLLLKLAFTFDRSFSERAIEDRAELIEGKISFEDKKLERLNQLKQDLKLREQILTDKQAKDLLERIWLREFDLSSFIANVNRKVYLSSNRFLNDDINSKAFKELSFAQTRNFGVQSFSDSGYGFFSNLTNLVGENIKSKDAKFILNYSAFGLTDYTQEFINANLDAFKVALNDKIKIAFENKDLPISNEDYLSLTKLIAESENAIQISSAMNKLDTLIIESEEFGNAYAASYKAFTELDKDILSSRENYNLNLLSEYAKSLGIKLEDAFDLAKLQETLYEKLADYSKGNFWASSGSANKRKEDLIRGIEKLEKDYSDKDGKKPKGSILYHQKVAGITDEDGFDADLHSNVVIVMNKDKFKDSMPINDADNYMYVQDSVNKIRMIKAFNYSLNSLDINLANKLLSLRDGNNVVKEDILLSNGNIIPKGFKIGQIVALPNGSYKVLALYETGFQPGAKVVVPGTKIAKATNGGELKGSLADVIKTNNLNVDFVYGSSSFDYKNITPLIGKSFKESQLTYYRYNEINKKLEETSALNADFAILKELPMQLTQTFFEGKIKRRDVDDITLSTSKRNIFGNVLFGDTFITVDKNDPTKISFNSENISEGAKALNIFNQPTLIGNNAAYLHGLLINSIALKYSGLSKAEQSQRINNFIANYDLASVASIANFWYIIQNSYDNDINKLLSKATDVEKIILSNNLYKSFFDEKNGRILNTSNDLIQKSKNAGFEREIKEVDSTLRTFKPEGEMARHLATQLKNKIFNGKYQNSLVFDTAFGHLSMLEYLNFIINSMNSINEGVPGYKRLNFITSKDAIDGSLLNILNLGKGIGSSLSEGFNTINMRDALIEQNPENYSLNQAHQKTAAVQPGTVYRVETKKILPSKFSELKKHNDFEQTESKFTNRFAATGKAFDDNNKKYVSDYKNLRSSINTNAEGGTPFTNLRHSEVRFLKYLLGTVGQAKDIYERVSLFGFNDKVYAPLSVTGISINSNDNRMSLGYDNEFIESDVVNIKKTIEDKINSRRFLDLFEFKSNNLKESIQSILKKDPNNVGLSTRIKDQLFEKETDELDGLLQEMPDADKTSAGQNIWNNMFKEEFALDNDDVKFRQKIYYEANKEKLTNVFNEDWLRSGLFKISNTDSGLSIEVERAVKDYLIEPVVLQKQFTQPLKDLHDFASSLGVAEKLNHYAAAKYYEYAIQKIEKNLANDNLKDSDRSSLNILLQTYKQDFNELRTGFATPVEFMQSFEKLYEPVVREFNRVNSALGLQFKKYSILTDESSDSLFYLLKPNVRKGLEKEEKLFMRLSMFTYNDEKEYEVVDLASYNYFDDLHTKLIMLSKQAATVNLSHKLKSLGLMANLPVKDFLTKTLLPELETAASSFTVTGKRGRELTDDVVDFFDDIDTALAKGFGLPSISKEVASDLITGKLGNALFKGYLRLETELAKRSDGMSRDQVFTLLRSTKPDSEEYKKAVALLNLYELQNNALIMLTNNLDKNILTNLYTSLKAEAERNGTVLSDKFGRILHEDPRDYKLIFSGSTEAVKHLVKYSSYAGGYEKNIILDALNGDVFFANKSLAESLDKNFFTTKMPNKVLQSIAKVNSLMSKLIMSNPFRYLDRLIGFTVYDVATLGSFEPKTFTKLPVAINQISAFLQSKYSVMSPELKEFLTESGIDIKSANFSEIFSGYDQKGLLDKLIDPITEPLGKGFNIQNIVGRFSYWMAVKENLDNNKPINYGPSLKIRDAVDSLQQKVNDDGEVLVSSNGRKAYFLMSEILGAPGDFPILARKLKGLAMFTTFPLAAARFTRGILGSASFALKEMFVGDNKQVALRWLTSTGLGMAGLFAVPWLIFELWGNVMGLSEEEKEEWKETGDGMPEFVRSIFTGSPVINKFNTFNQYALLESMTTKPFKEAIDEGGTLIDGAGRWILDNIASRGPAPLKLTAEVLGGFDSFGGTIQDNTDQWSMWENFQRKIAAYVIGGSGANALTTYLNKDLKYTDDSFAEIFVNGFRTVIEAEMGNTVAFKTDIKNYYRANNIIQSARFANPRDPFYTSSNFDTDNYNDVKNEIGRAMRRKAKPSVIYGIIIDAMREGVDIREIRSAVRNNSLEYKLSQVPNLGEFYNNLSESEYKTINNAIAYERQIYPFLNDLLIQVNDLYKRNASTNNYTPRVYIPRVYNTNNYRTNYSYNYNNFVRNSKYNNLFRIYDPFKAFRASWFKLNNLDKPQE